MSSKLALAGPHVRHFVIVVGIVTLYLNISAIHYGMSLDMWARTLPIVLMTFGLIGRLKNIKLLIILGWLGIAAFFFIALVASFPPEEYRIIKPEYEPDYLFPVIGKAEVVARILSSVLLSSLSLFFYRRLGMFMRKLE